MARRQDTGSNAAHQNQRPTPHNEDAVPEMTEEIGGRAEDVDEDAFDDTEELDEEDQGDEGNR
jgi:hypothetical protein